MATTQYIGARYVPRHMGEWDANTQYGALDVVLYTNGNSYTAKCFPPKGTPPTNGQFWSLSAQFNQQLAALQNFVNENTEYREDVNNYITPEMFGCVGDGVTDDTLNFKNCVAESRNTKKYIKSGGGKKYKLTEPIDVSNAFLDMGGAEIISSANHALYIDSETYYTTIKNIVFDCSGCNCAIKIKNGRKILIDTVVVNNAVKNCIEYLSGYELVVQNCHFNGSTNSGTCGLWLESGDSLFYNIIMINCQKAIHNLNGFNTFIAIHAWILTRTLLPDSIYIESNGGHVEMLGCYSDTYYKTIVVNQYPTIYELSNMTVLYNNGIMNQESVPDVPFFFYSDVSSADALVNMSACNITGVQWRTPGCKTTNTNKCLFKMCSCILRSCNINATTDAIDTANKSANVTSVKAELKKENNNVWFDCVAQVDSTTKTVTIGTLPYYFRPTKDINFVCFYGNGEFNITGVAYMYITNAGVISCTLPESASGNVYIKILCSFINGNER